MPPGPLYNWICVAHSVCDILSHAAQIRAAQLASAANSARTPRDSLPRRTRPQDGRETKVLNEDHSQSVGQQQFARTSALRDEAVFPNNLSGGTPLTPQSSTGTSDFPSPAAQGSIATGVRDATLGEVTPETVTQLLAPTDAVPHVPTSSTHDIAASNSVIMMSSEDPSREVLEAAMARESSPVIGTTSEVPAHDVPATTGVPEVAATACPRFGLLRFVTLSALSGSQSPHPCHPATCNPPGYPLRALDGSSTTEVSQPHSDTELLLSS
ncbi:uncharacterized protein B0H18DRAFT_631210 [Fomitopsis serialis]|uniref:uncharacterized protein n=1 Tax=Fomitopsis serialis TaxID=139415 RepID=UPI0020079B13|nr:uncharacterized protein B0H18DRAFT_631210 [Neoantrodia serialis]KAH9919646.1 hypothetical protein B0H18DRAFT_631210 [Neoantrodia serialis]